MKKAAIETISKEFLLSNYGSFFQHWSLRAVLKKNGFDVFRIPGKQESSLERNLIYEFLYRFASVFWHVFRWGKKLKEELRQSICLFRGKCRFLTDYRRLIGEVNETFSLADVQLLIGGSDQMWNAKMFHVFRPNLKAAKITYAASGDWKKLSQDQELLSLMERDLPSYVAVSVREKAGVSIVGRYKENVFHAIDPVFLHSKEDYYSLISTKKVFRNPTLVCYFVNIHDKDNISILYWQRFADILGVKLKFIGLQGAEKFIPLALNKRPSPGDFLRYFRDADYVVTNSFHGTVFALLMNKKFVCIKQKELPGASQNVRCEELLVGLGLQDRYLPIDSLEHDIMSIINEDINYKVVNNNIAKWREESLNWLTNILNAI